MINQVGVQDLNQTYNKHPELVCHNKIVGKGG